MGNLNLVVVAPVDTLSFFGTANKFLSLLLPMKPSRCCHSPKIVGQGEGVKTYFVACAQKWTSHPLSCSLTLLLVHILHLLLHVFYLIWFYVYKTEFSRDWVTDCLLFLLCNSTHLTGRNICYTSKYIQRDEEEIFYSCHTLLPTLSTCMCVKCRKIWPASQLYRCVFYLTLLLEGWRMLYEEYSARGK